MCDVHHLRSVRWHVLDLLSSDPSSHPIPLISYIPTHRLASYTSDWCPHDGEFFFDILVDFFFGARMGMGNLISYTIECVPLCFWGRDHLFVRYPI